ncbi:enoyl-CoA hydratase/isomerase family protein [Ammoniphilus sp. 3BR4]|uniref:enoyl-CoA hydratase/isomerase family protein n=1 Tax=Ammoniphilus sp. 3BR4 TaxID=3158265 RepID=UPI003465F36E
MTITSKERNELIMETLQYRVENRVGYIYLNRPPFNPLNKKLFVELYDLLEQIEDDENVRAVILTGSGERAFAAGADITEMSQLDAAGVAKMGVASRKAFEKLERLSKPVIAAVNGLALGGGTELALVCDLRISSDKAKFALPEVNLGIIPGGGGTQRLQRLIGQSRAKEMLFFGDMITADQALNYGLVNKVVPAEELIGCATEWALKLTEKAPVAMQMIKTSVNGGAQVDLATALDLETACFGNAFASEDRVEGMTAFAEKRKANFVGR